MEDNKKFKHSNIRMPYEIWDFLKDRAKIENRTMANIITDLLYRYKEKCEKRLNNRK